MFFSNLVWDPNRNFFVIPYIDHPITWYGLFFASGFLVGYFLVRKLFTHHLSQVNHSLSDVKLDAIKLTDRLALLVILGTIIGARLGHVFFYGWSYYKAHPLDIFKVWEGGLASHGGAIGVLIGLAIFVWWNRCDYKQLTFLVVLDILMIPSAFVAGCIRLGNFMNQEITGTPTSLPWGVIFKRPIEGVAGIPLHPVQIYESIAYFAVFIFLCMLWRKRSKYIGYGLLSGWFFTLVFSIRFLLEFFKMPQSDWLGAHSPISMGQILSIPFVILGISLLIWYYMRKRKDAAST